MTTELSNRERVSIIRKRNPCMTLAAIGEAVGLTRERVRQLLKEQGEVTKAYVPHPVVECINCGKPTRNEKFCSMKCYSEYYRPLIECSQCGKQFRIRASRLTSWNKRMGSTRHFCSKECIGRFTGLHYGFAAHPENSLLGKIALKQRGMRNAQKSPTKNLS